MLHFLVSSFYMPKFASLSVSCRSVHMCKSAHTQRKKKQIRNVLQRHKEIKEMFPYMELLKYCLQKIIK